MDSSFNIQNYFKRGKTVVLTLRQGDTEEVRQWSDKDTSQLLSLMNEFLPEFQNQRRRKKEVWADISKKLSDDGYCWTPEDCRKKWSNMVRTFKGIQEQKQDPTLSSKRIKWPFFEYMGELLALEGADYLPEATNIVQLLNNPMQAPASPTAILSSRSNDNRLEEEQPSSSTGTAQTNTPDTDMVGVAVDLASIMNGSSGDEVTILDSLRSGEIDQSQAPATVERIIVQDRGSSMNQNSQGQQTPDHSPLKTVVRSEKLKNRKRVRTKSNLSSDSSNPDSLLERFISMTNKHNEVMLEQLTSFQDNALELMQERNDILRRLCNVFEQQSSPYDGSEDGTTTSTADLRRYRFPDGSESSENFDHTAPIEQGSQSQNRVTGTAYQIGSRVASSTDRTNSGDLAESIMPADNVDIVDPDSLQTLIAQDSVGGITFHLDIPSNSNTSPDNNETHQRMLPDQKGHVRLENISSDVNLSAFSSSLPPYFVSVLPDSTKKPRFNLSKSVSVPLHQGHRKIAPRK